MNKQFFTGAVLALSLASTAAFADSAAAPEHKGKVLLVASSTNTLTFKDGRTHPTGYFLGELVIPAQAFLKAGYDVVIATPDGNTPALDANSITTEHFEGSEARLADAMRFVTTYPGMQKPKKLHTVVQKGLADFDGIYLPGGHAPMVDLMQDKDLGTALRQFHAAGKATGLLCHGPIALTSSTDKPAAFRAAMVSGDVSAAAEDAQGWIYKGYKMTVYSTAEEKSVEKFLGGDIQFYMEDALTAAGGVVQVRAPGTAFIVEDRELVTGQNPNSAHMIADAMIKKLDAQKAVQ
ncbi:type 1 glutamine amidotransferase domain-containing protein [Klebsiella quasivariicola]|uniref:type 1 glutamine amidotransferase domain-containing protein n=1 Tax=Klebsiella quasivariicola TaxID=2026240 RepID=UPI00109BD32E|nr:type 1 glutamine amidotransferase domain-containing protein [Klebsiella quasivariicola]UDC38170.1 type 1 glutamine amidotransferase domain-containing protein [Klebsiella quasivariicola]VAN61334.1 ThiJ/PfpI domain-containing protein [Klebsiella quasivariicola]VGP03528.1 Molecular chaperone Hsp31 and glyoxalase 3 [Klebsiella quasivariicola]